MNRSSWHDTLIEYLWPFYEADTVWICENIFSTDEREVSERFEAVEIKVIDILPILLIVYIGWTSDYEGWIMEVTPQECSNECALPTTEISREKYPLSSNKGKKKFRNSTF